MDSLAPGKSELKWFYGITLTMLGAGLYFLSKENFWFAAFPLALVIVYLAIFSLDTILLIITFCTPIAITLNDKASGPAISFPTEPLMFGVMLLFIFKFIFEGKFDRNVLYHPVSIALYIVFGWMFITSLTSSYPIVSFKHLLSQLWFVIPFYFLGTQLFRNKKRLRTFVWLYLISLLIIIGYTIVQHAQNSWTQKAAHWVMYPFYNDHTAYAAVIALFIPISLTLATSSNASKNERWVAWIFTLVLFIAIILSYTRAAWLSLIVALGVYIIVKLRIKFHTVLMLGIAALAVFLTFRTDIMMKLEKNRQDSATDFNKHIQSISNISTDASNLERINRWNSAFRMWRERPVLGWGPGTYQFNYAPFQKSNEMTIISTNAGDMGNAHSEYIGPLAEQGVPGMAFMILLVIVIFYTGFRFYSRSDNAINKKWALGILLGLITYFIHGTLNNFLDTDKLSVPVWGFVAMLVALDVYHNEKDQSGREDSFVDNGRKTR